MANYNGDNENALTNGGDNAIDNLKNALNGGLKKSKYRIAFNFYENNDFTKFFADGELNRLLSTLCIDISFPPKDIQTVEYWHLGRKYTMRAEANTAGSVDITFYEDYEMTVRRIFDNWQAKIDNPLQTGVKGSLKKTVMVDEYRCDLCIQQLDGHNNPVYGYKLKNAFLTNIGAITLDSTSENELIEFNVTITYSDIVSYFER